MKRFLNFIYAIVAVIAFTACSDDSSQVDPGNTGSGSGGSLARFAISGDVLYTVDNTHLKVFSITNPQSPTLQGDIDVGTGVETIFPRGNTLFLGSQIGMYIYDITSPTQPERLSVYEHVFSCDPVVADDNYAYVTLRSGNLCFRGVNRLEVIDIQNLRSPQLAEEYPMERPQGLGIDDTTLFVCDNGLKVFNAKDPLQLEQKDHFSIAAKDVIPLDGILLVIGDDGLYQYRYEGHELTLLSKL